MRTEREISAGSTKTPCTVLKLTRRYDSSDTILVILSPHKLKPNYIRAAKAYKSFKGQIDSDLSFLERFKLIEIVEMVDMKNKGFSGKKKIKVQIFYNLAGKKKYSL